MLMAKISSVDGAVCHISLISAGVRARAWLTRSLSVRSRVKVSAARSYQAVWILRRRIYQGVFGKSNFLVDRGTELLPPSPLHKTRQFATQFELVIAQAAGLNVTAHRTDLKPRQPSPSAPRPAPGVERQTETIQC